jgi:hypothetical protein
VLSEAAFASEEFSLLVEAVVFSTDETDVVVDFSVLVVEDIVASVSVSAEVVLAVDVVVAVVLSDETSTFDELLSPLQPVSQIADKRINGSSLFIVCSLYNNRQPL